MFVNSVCVKLQFGSNRELKTGPKCMLIYHVIVSLKKSKKHIYAISCVYIVNEWLVISSLKFVFNLRSGKNGFFCINF